jgi:hypothetical protein
MDSRRGLLFVQFRRSGYDHPVQNETDPKTPRQWIRHIIVVIIALFLVWWMLRIYVL